MDPESSYQYCSMVFASWDYALTDTKIATIKQKSIYYDIAVSDKTHVSDMVVLGSFSQWVCRASIHSN